MRSTIKSIHGFLFASLLFLAACGTFEIGIENNVIPDEQEETPQTTQVEPGNENIGLEETDPAPTPVPSDEEQIRAALAEKLGQPVDQRSFSVTAINGDHAKGGIENGYFLAAREGDAWVVVYNGQATPPCVDIEEYEFPAGMVPECLDTANQLVVRSGSTGGDIGDVLAEHLGVPREEVNFTIMQEEGNHLLGYMPGGYFLAANVSGQWQIIFDGNGTPYCSMVDLHDFPAFMVPECMDADNNLVYRTDRAADLPELQSLDCAQGSPGASPGTAESVACNIQDALRSRNISALLGYLEDPFIIGYWLSEGVFYSPEDFLNLLPQLYNFNDPNYTPRLTFTTDRGLFPELDGRPLEEMFGPDVNVVEIVYSEGWGAGGDDEALIFISQDAAGDFKWHSMLLGDLDVPVPGPGN